MNVLGIMLIVFVVCSVVLLGVTMLDRRLNISINAGRCNYKVRYNASNRKYYITNHTPMGDIDVRHFGIFRIYYKSKIDADFVMQKLNAE